MAGIGGLGPTRPAAIAYLSSWALYRGSDSNLKQLLLSLLLRKMRLVAILCDKRCKIDRSSGHCWV